MIERNLAAEDPNQDREPLETLLIAVVVPGLAMPEHVELVLVPSAHDVQPGAAAAHMIDGRERLGGEHRMHERNMHGREDRNVPGDGGKRRGVSQRLERGGAHLGRAAVTLPARDRKNEFDAGIISRLRNGLDFLPIGTPPIGNFRESRPAVCIDGEKPELEAVGVPHRIARAHPLRCAADITCCVLVAAHLALQCRP